jgi:hypothetical protein
MGKGWSKGPEPEPSGCAGFVFFVVLVALAAIVLINATKGS